MKKKMTAFLLLSLSFLACLLPGVFLTSLNLAQAATIPNDPYYYNQWYLSKIRADAAWAKINSSPDITIAVVDAGIDIDHPDLQDNIWINNNEIDENGLDDDRNGFIDDRNGWDFLNNKPDPRPNFLNTWTESGISHGTMVAGIIAAVGNNGQGISGVTWRAKIMPLKVLNEEGEGRLNDVIRAIDYAVNNGADIINLSFVSFDYSDGLQAAIRRAYQSGVLVVAAAGNEQSAGLGYDTDKTPIYPACYDGDNGENMVLGVAATDALDQKAKFSSYGIKCVDITAPGVSFFSTITRGGSLDDAGAEYDGFWSGTSMAAPLVSGTIALMEEINPDISRQEIIDTLFNSADSINRLNVNYLGQLGHGRINVARAVEMAAEKLYSRSSYLLIAPPKGNNKLLIVDKKGSIFKILPNQGNNRVTILGGDVNGDGQEEIIVAPLAGQEPVVKIYNISGKLLKQFLAYDKTFRGGLSLALGDVDGDGSEDIVVLPLSGAGSQLKVFNYQGQLKKQFLVDKKNYYGGFSVAAGDIDGSGQAEIVVAYGAGAKAALKIYNYQGKLQGQFYPYGANFRGGLKVAIGNIDGRNNHNRQEIIVAPGAGSVPTVKVFDNHARLKLKFDAYGSTWRGGFSVAAGDLNNDGRDEIITGALAGAAPHVRVFDGKGNIMESFYAYDEKFSGGTNVGVIRINN